jgi:hypothetical protein
MSLDSPDCTAGDDKPPLDYLRLKNHPPSGPGRRMSITRKSPERRGRRARVCARVGGGSLPITRRPKGLHRSKPNHLRGRFSLRFLSDTSCTRCWGWGCFVAIRNEEMDTNE